MLYVMSVYISVFLSWLQQASQEIKQLEEAAELEVIISVERGLHLYQNAISICNSFNFTNRAAKIHCKCAEIELNLGYRYLQAAIEDADESIKKDPDHLMVCIIVSTMLVLA